MLPRRFLQSLNSLSNKKLNSISGSRNLSTHPQIFNLRLKNNKHLYSKGYKHCRICNVIPSRFLNTSNIIGPDNIVSTPYGNVEIPNSLLHEFAWESVEKWPENVAIECGITGRNYTYSQLRNRCKEFGASLLKSGFKPGDVISIMLPNIPEFPIALYGAVEAGLIVSTVNPTYTPDELFHQLVDSNSIAVITFADRIDVAKAAKLKLEEKTKGALSLKIISVQEYDGKSRSCPQGVWSLKEMINNNIDTSILSSVNGKSKPTDVVCLPYSSGTTGLPKGVCLTHQNLVSNVTQIKEKDIEQIITSYGDFQDVLPAVLPFFHIFGLNVVLNTALNNGAKLVTLPKFEPELFFKVLKEHKNTIFYIVPPLVLFLSAHPAVTKELLQYIRFVCSGAAPIGASDIERFLTKVPDSSYFIQGYGLTETSPVAIIPNNRNRNLSSVGHPVPLTKAKIIDETGKALGIGELGEVCITGPQIMKEYLNRPQATAETIKDGWFFTGDIGYYDKDGYFYIVDRKKELIKVKGFQVAPAELEELLRNHPQIADVAVIGVPDARSGELPVAYVVPKPGQEQVSTDNIKKFVADKVTEYKQLSQVIITPAIPKSASGKILRKDLKASYLEAKK